MRTQKENVSREDYLEEVMRYFGIKDTITMVEGELGTDWECDEVIEFRNSCGCLLSRYNCDKEIVEYW